ncbi:MAG: 50S ribosomal protein L1 [Candidatus Doudnabacteria bacterium RIFCSPHIGHO2_01_FULL_49_9]|uniref:Large ribosomal subunit protein uL1 n=1 Tax=Candidatus Doudnabacteria bacterium RIFCSPHIGHO2_01_FULL_49_9 TaxID=1817827 RepID=A0A1F5P2G8_9BACT|nr:MAG: 50S ribosomal protein L1 [Candidatus Doudnabacteria bacterium RIFCSPHIGHO2_01_FULL_49_9]
MSKRFQETLKLVDLDKTYSIEEALKLAKQTSTVKFDASVEVHIRLGIDTKQTDQKVRTQVSLPHGIGKTMRVAAFVSSAKEQEAKDAGADVVGGEDLVKQIKQTEKTDFDIAVADTGMMKTLATIAKILGQRGLMPSPKTGSVGEDVAKMVKDLKSGSKIDVKTDDSGNIHQVIGKVSFDDQKLLENFQALKEAIHRAKPSSVKKEFITNITLTTSMGPGIKVQQ